MNFYKRHYFYIFSIKFNLFLIFLIISGLIAFDGRHFLKTPLIPANKKIHYILPAGSSVRILSHDLVQSGYLNRPRYLEILAYLKGYAKHLHAGEYEFKSGLTPGQLLKQIFDGQVVRREMTFTEGMTFRQMLSQIENNPFIIHELALFSPMLIMIKLKLSGLNPEGLFFPAAYRYTAGMSDKMILLNAYKTMQKKLSVEWKNRAGGLSYQNCYQALIAASIIEKEAKKNNERAMIAGVILRRLQKNMLLQMDSTVIYALGESFHPPLKKDNLKTDNFYNTYRYKGLPPTPICMPGEASIHAALHPDIGDSLYFVAKGNGAHQFSATYQAHIKAIKAYRANRAALDY